MTPLRFGKLTANGGGDTAKARPAQRERQRMKPLALDRLFASGAWEAIFFSKHP